MLEWGADNVRVNTICPWARSDHWDGSTIGTRARLPAQPVAAIGEPEADIGGGRRVPRRRRRVVRDRADHPRRRREHGLPLGGTAAPFVTRDSCPPLYRPFTKRWVSGVDDLWCEAAGLARKSTTMRHGQRVLGAVRATCVGVRNFGCRCLWASHPASATDRFKSSTRDNDQRLGRPPSRPASADVAAGCGRRVLRARLAPSTGGRRRRSMQFDTDAVRQGRTSTRS